MTDRARQGFTLMEVLVALIILAVMATGMIRLATHAVEQADYLTDKTMAALVASNALTEIELAHSWPDVKAVAPEAEMGHKKWRVSVQVSTTASDDLKKVEVQVAPLEAAPGSGMMASFTGFVGKH